MSKLLLSIAVMTISLRSAQAQERDPDGSERNLRAYIELIRSDVKTEKVAIITQVMDLDEADAAKFWPIYHEYDAELTKLGDQKLALVKDYIDHYEALTDPKAHTIAFAVFDMEGKRTELKKKYYTKFEHALSARTAARFFQIENQIQMLMDLQLAAALPVMK